MRPSATVMAFKDLHLDGNIIPMAWFKHLKYDNGKPDLNAIMILSDLVYWYRPTPVRDEPTGQVSGYRQKFKHDLLQKSYQSYVDLFGLSKGQVTDALGRLEAQGLVKRVFRHLETPRGTLPNVLFIDLNPDNIQQLSQSSRDLPIHPEISPDLSRDVSGSIGGYLPTDPETNTEITTKSTTKTLSTRAQRAQQMMEIWNQTFEAHPPVQLTSLRQTKLLLVLAASFNNALPEWQQFCDHIRHSPFLQGKGPRGWRATLDWCLEEPNLTKILEGNYQNNAADPPQVLSREETHQRAQVHLQSLADPQHYQLGVALCAALTPSIYNHWFHGMRLEHRDGVRIRLSFPTRFIRDYVEINYFSTLQQVVQPLYPGPQHLTLTVQTPSLENENLEIDNFEAKTMKEPLLFRVKNRSDRDLNSQSTSSVEEVSRLPSGSDASSPDPPWASTTSARPRIYLLKQPL